MYRGLKVLILFLGMFALLSLPLNAASKPKFSGLILVDTRQMLLAHPLFGKFDPKTRRFTGTRSETYKWFGW